MFLSKQQKKIRRKSRVRAKVKGMSSCPRLAIFRSNRHLYAQVIDDEFGKTIFGLNSSRFSEDFKSSKKSEIARVFGKKFADLVKEKKVLKVIFDRSCYAYHGRVKAFAEGAREGGLLF